MNRLQLDSGGRIAHTEILRNDYAATGALPSDTEDLVNFTRSIIGVEVGLFFMEQPRGGVKVSFRSCAESMWRGWQSNLAAAATVWRPGPSSKHRWRKPRPACWTPFVPPFDPLPPASGAITVGDESPLSGLTLRNLPIPSRLVLSCFLGAMAFGYVAALVQLHFNGGTKPGELLPGQDEVVATYYGSDDLPMSRLERLIVASEDLPFAGNGTMRPAFKAKSSGWPRRWGLRRPRPILKAALDRLHKEREGEADAVVVWARAVASRETCYGNDDFALPAREEGWIITKEYVIEEDGKPARVKIKKLINDRCSCCHSKDEEIGGRDRDAAKKCELDSIDKLKKYVEVKPSSAMELKNLALTTHVHMFGFTIMYCLTGLIFSFTNFPNWVRLIVAPAAIVASVTEIGIGWWVGRLHPCPAAATQVLGGVTGAVLMVQIFGSLFDMYAKKGRLVLLTLIAGTAIGACWCMKR